MLNSAATRKARAAQEAERQKQARVSDVTRRRGQTQGEKLADLLSKAEAAERDFRLRADLDRSHEASMSNVVQSYKGTNVCVCVCVCVRNHTIKCGAAQQLFTISFAFRFVRSPRNNTTDPSRKAYFKEFKKLVDAADVILEVLDARDPLGCRCADIERRILTESPQKKIVYECV